MEIDAGILAGDLYNALAERGITVRKVIYDIGGGWHLQVDRKGGLLKGLPIIAYIVDHHEIDLRLKRLFGSKHVASFNLKELTNKDHLVGEICDLVVSKVR